MPEKKTNIPPVDPDLLIPIEADFHTRGDGVVVLAFMLGTCFGATVVLIVFWIFLKGGL